MLINSDYSFPLRAIERLTGCRTNKDNNTNKAITANTAIKSNKANNKN